MKTGYKMLSVACLVAFVGISLNSQMVLAQDAEGNNVTQPATIEEQAPTRSPWLGVGLSLGSTLVLTGIGTGLVVGESNGVRAGIGTGLLAIGTIIAPSVGQLYSERWLKAGLFTLGRAAVVGLSAAIIAADSNKDSWGPSEGQVIMGSIGIAALFGLTVWDIVDSYSSAKTFNKEHAKNSISVSPFMMPSESGNGEHGTAYGLAVAGHF